MKQKLSMVNISSGSSEAHQLGLNLPKLEFFGSGRLSNLQLAGWLEFGSEWVSSFWG